MKIAYLVNTYPLASLSFIRREIMALREIGIQVEPFTIRRWETALVDPADQAQAQETRCILEAGKWHLVAATGALLIRHPIRFVTALNTACRLGWKSDRGLLYNLFYLVEACVLLRWLKSAGFTHVHAHFGTNSTAVALLCHKLGGPPFSFTVHGPEEFEKPQKLKLSYKIAEAQFVIAVSEYGRSQLYRWCGADQWSKIHVVHCGVDPTFLGIETSPSVSARLVFVGRFVEQKGTMFLIEAAKILAARGIAYELILIGDGPLRGQIEAAIARFGLKDRIHLLGWQSNEQVRQAILESRALVLPSQAEGLPVVLMEALALGRPVIASAIAGIPELVEDGECGYLIPPAVVHDLAEAMIKMLGLGAAELRRMGHIGIQKVAAKHNCAIEARRLAELLK